MTWQQIVGWVAWVVLACFAAAWTFGCYTYVKRGAGLTYATLNTTVVWWFLLGWTFYYSTVNKLHLFWLAPSVILMSLFITTSRAIGSTGGRRMLSPGLGILLVSYGLVMWWLTN